MRVQKIESAADGNDRKHFAWSETLNEKNIKIEAKRIDNMNIPWS